MKSHMEILANSPSARTKKPELKVTPKIRMFVETQLMNYQLTVGEVKHLFQCDKVKATLIMKEVHRRRKQEGLEKPIIRDGFIYLIENDAYPGWIKCGMTTQIKSRLDSYNSYDPLKRFQLVASSEVQNRRKSESLLLHEMKVKSSLQTGEWFKIDKETALKIFERVS